MIQRFLVVLLLCFVVVSDSFGISLKENVIEALNTNPIVLERLKNFRATKQDLNIAEAEYYPSLG